MISLGIFIRRRMQRKKKRTALNEEAMQSDSSTEMPGAKDHDPSPMRSIEPSPGAADTIVNVKSTDLPGSSLGHVRGELEATSPFDDGPAELPEKSKPASPVHELDGRKEAPRVQTATELPETTTRDPQQQQQRAELDATTAETASQRAELRGSRTPDHSARSELESAALRYDQRPPQSSHSNHRDVFIDAPERLTPRSSTDGGRRLAELAT
ncbi:hypothetical protein PG993_000265 [Apiospora rasikravindrae]|uniref:Uncharacterized protein n=1 Tax=Apiospora rasikravindrae TaxID=990691 RepID=A0ABR1UAS3_9PEZI